MSDISEQEKVNKMNKLAREVLLLSRNTLLVNLRFLDAALSQFEYVIWPEGTLSTNGKYLFYNPKYVLKCYMDEKEIPVRDYLHMVMHCIFQHMYGVTNVDRNIWDLACDIAVEHSITDLDLKAVTASREKKEVTIFQELEKDIGKLTAERIYRYYKDKDLSYDEIELLKSIFKGDDHNAWYRKQSETETIRKNAATSGSEENENHSDDISNSCCEHNDENSDSNNESNYGNNENNNSENDIESNFNLTNSDRLVWKTIAERMQVEMETFQKNRGIVAGNMLQNLHAVNREKYDYTSFLKKFAIYGETMKINDEEFDYVYYTYGLNLYKNMPLIEPLEYKDVKRIREFVIAIDTSGSVMGDQVQAFVQKTYNILKNTESFFSKINLHIIQCDVDIQEHVKITSQEKFDNYLQNMELKGFGGTDFRPVFNMVDELIRNKEFNNLKGLIYFTDGDGIFPDKKPNYETAFVFVNDEDENPIVPSWAIKLVLQREEL